MKDEGYFESGYGGALKRCFMGGSDGGCGLVYVYNGFIHNIPTLDIA